MRAEEVLAKIDESPTGEVPASVFFEGVYVPDAQKPIVNLLAKMRLNGSVKMGKNADGETVYSRLTDAEKAARADREAAKETRRAEIAAEKAAKKAGGA